MRLLLALAIICAAGSWPTQAFQATSQSSLQARLTTALSELRAGNTDKALTLYREILRSYPNSAEAHNWLGVALADKSKLLEAIAEFRKAVALDPKFARAWTNLGSTLAKSGNPEESVRAFRKALVCNPADPAAHMNLALALRASGDARDATQELRWVLAKYPQDARVQYELAQTLRQSGQLQSAIESFETALGIDPELREAYYGLGQTLKQIAATHRHAPPSADTAAENSLGFSLGQKRDLNSALEHLNRAIVLSPDYAEAHYNLGVALWYSGSKEKAVAELQESIRQNPAAGESYAFLGTALEEMGDREARRNLQRAIALLPPMPSVYVDLGLVLLASGDTPRALGQFEAALNLPSSSPAPAWEKAIEGLRQALAKNPKDAAAHNVLGRLMGRAGADSKDVASEFREAIRLKPDFAEAQNNLGLVLTQSGDDEGAIAAFREAVRLAPSWAEAHSNLGAALTPTDVPGAVRELEKALELDSSSVKARYNLALAYGLSPEHGMDQEIEQLRKVITAAPDFARGHVALGKALLEKGDVAQAVDQLQTAVKLDPSVGEAHYQLGLALSRAGRKDEAMPEIRKGRELVTADERTQNFSLDLSEGKQALDRGELDQAVAKFRHALRIQPESGAANRLLGMALAKQGDSAASIVAFRKALEIDPDDTVAKQNLERLTSRSESGDDPQQVQLVEKSIREHRFSEVELSLTEYLRARPNSWWGWYALGYSQFGQQKIGASIQSLAKSLQLNIKNAEAHKILGRDLMIVGRFDAARTEFEQGIRLSPQSAELHYDLGKLFSINDDWPLAKRELEETVRIDPSYIEAWDALGFAAESLGNDAEAVTDYQKAIHLNESRKGQFASAQVNLSAFYNRTEQPDKALEYAKAALALNPQNDRAWFQQAKAYEKLGQLDAAVSSAKHATDLNSRASSYYYVLAMLYRRIGKSSESREALAQFTKLDQESSEIDKKRRDLDLQGNRGAQQSAQPVGSARVQ
jgi:tetratricopeptide (TPR) repeat protein